MIPDDADNIVGIINLINVVALVQRIAGKTLPASCASMSMRVQS